MLKPFRADLHMHTCLSPCAELDMTPREIVRTAIQRGLAIIAVTDHNSAENIESVRRAAQGTDLAVLAGMEITSSEEVHLLGLFEDVQSALCLQDIVYENLPQLENDEQLYGHQVIISENDEIVGLNRRLLITATRLCVCTLVEAIGSLGGISIASHIDRDTFSVLSQLAFIPEDLRFDALEVSPRLGRDGARASLRGLERFPWVSFSDAHHLKDIGTRSTVFTIREPTLGEIRMALKNATGRAVAWP